MKPFRLLLLIFAAVLSGLLTMLLLPYIFIVFLHHWERHEADRLASAANPHSPTDAVRCDGGEEHPFFQEWQRLEEMRRMQVDRIDKPPVVLPDAIEKWMKGYLR
jgi:hypothetical protein